MFGGSSNRKTSRCLQGLLGRPVDLAAKHALDMEIATIRSNCGAGICWTAASSLSGAPGKFRCTICHEVLDVFDGHGGTPIAWQWRQTGC